MEKKIEKQQTLNKNDMIQKHRKVNTATEVPGNILMK